MQWTEITQENVEELHNIPEWRLVVVTKTPLGIDCRLYYRWLPALNYMAKRGGYYYIELPELKINKNE